MIVNRDDADVGATGRPPERLCGFRINRICTTTGDLPVAPMPDSRVG
jgi:hypothetical protein